MVGALTPALAQDTTPSFESAAAAAFESVIESMTFPVWWWA